VKVLVLGGAGRKGQAAALAILRGDVKKSGVLPPEACFEPMAFFSEVARFGPEEPLDGKFLGESFEWLE